MSFARFHEMRRMDGVYDLIADLPPIVYFSDLDEFERWALTPTELTFREWQEERELRAQQSPDYSAFRLQRFDSFFPPSRA